MLATCDFYPTIILHARQHRSYHIRTFTVQDRQQISSSYFILRQKSSNKILFYTFNIQHIQQHDLESKEKYKETDLENFWKAFEEIQQINVPSLFRKLQHLSSKGQRTISADFLSRMKNRCPKYKLVQTIRRQLLVRGHKFQEQSRKFISIHQQVITCRNDTLDFAMVVLCRQQNL